ncbi:gamma-sarcoglycan isoform X2 [Aethina tumida]|uniref:gamma-sarcoglycan isoform X2 n=1 Tax=Aethina tumida TaxID=116153 RepID=UPI002147BCB0|nr:gamma-sarcoglycan isoform X2 [Aethina tumida]
MRMKKILTEPSTSGTTAGNRTDLDSFQSNVISLYGWRKKCLYMLMLVIILLVGINLGLTLWFMKVMQFSSVGMGQLKIVSGGLKLDGKAYILGNLIVSSIRSRTGQPIVFESTRNFTLRARNEKGKSSSWIKLDDQFECMSNLFKITDDRNQVLFSANRDEVVVGSDNLRVMGEGGTIFRKAVQTPLVRAPPGQDLRLTSPTRQLSIYAPRGLRLESLGGKIHAESFDNMTFHSEAGALRLESKFILMPRLPTAKISKTKVPSKRRNSIFQLCACMNGKLFLAPPHTVCATDDENFCQ